MNELFPKVLQAVPADGYTVHAHMNDGTVRCVDVKRMIEKGGVFAPLRDLALFRGNLTVLNDTVAWDMTGKHDPADCIDLDPFTIQAFPAVIETNLTDDEKAIIRQGREDYKQGGFVPLN